MSKRVLAMVVCLSLSANAFVNFGNAVLYDEFDLSTYKTFPLTQCVLTSCKVYVSAPESSLEVLEKIYLGDTTLAKIAGQVDNSTGLKTPYELKAYSGKAFIANLNWLFKSAPVAIYVVYESAPFYTSGLVYDPTVSPVVNWTTSNPITVLSASNFTIKGEVKEGSLSGGKVIAAGFDSVEKNWALTPSVYDFSNDNSFDLSFTGPLATLYAFENATVDVTIVDGFQVSTAPRSFLTSPGYTGVITGQVYRSSLYNKSVQYNLTFEQETTVQFEAFLNTFFDLVNITVDGNETVSISGTRGLPSYRQLFDVHGSNITITFKRSADLSSFLFKINTEVDELTSTESPSSDSSVTLSQFTDGPVGSSNASAGPVTDAPVDPTESPVQETEKPEVPVETEAPAVHAETQKPESPEEHVQETESPVFAEPEEPSVSVEALRFRRLRHPIV